MQKVGARRTVSPNESADNADVKLPMSKLILDILNLYNNYNKFSFVEVVPLCTARQETLFIKSVNIHII